MSEDNITSKVTEKFIDLAKEFLGKLIMPAAEELGLLMQDPIKIWRFNRQVKMLNKTREICAKNNIKPKEIPIKLIVPLLDGASLEDDDFLLDKWATLLANLVDSKQNFENHVFPYLLGQISKKEFEALKIAIDFEISRKEILQGAIQDLETELREKENGLEHLTNQSDRSQEDDEQLTLLKGKVRNLKNRMIPHLEFRKAALYPLDNELNGVEIENLIRLGLAKMNSTAIPSEKEHNHWVITTAQSEYLRKDLREEYHLEPNITALGKLLIEACSEKE